MGCISSKAITRSLSIREELNHGFQSASAAWEELLLTSHSGNDQLFALVCSANTKTTKPRTSSFTMPSIDNNPQTPLENNNLANSSRDLIPDIDAKREPEYGKFTRSKSCQMIRDNEMLGLASDGVNENKLDWKDKNLIGSRSFHTVEEYDALLERIHKFSSRSVEPFEDYYSCEDLRQSNSFDENKEVRCIQMPSEDSLCREDFSSFRNSDDFENVVQVDGKRETGWKRKAIAKGLKSLDVPTVEFPAVARFRQRIQMEGQDHSPGTYVTPKFGSYNAKVPPATQEKDGGENSVFSPELIAAFEDCMQQLQVEEERILRRMDGYSPVHDEMENQNMEI